MQAKGVPRFAGSILLAFSLAGTAVGQEGGAQEGSWWNIPYPRPFDATSLSRSQSPIRVDGNRFVDANGDTVVFRGVSLSDPDKIALDGHWSKEHFAAAAAWGADILRIPVHPVAWRGRGQVGYFQLLDDAVRWANELGLYLIIDWHSIGNLESGLFQHPMYDTSKQETLSFWRSVAARYRGIPTVAFYEIFNEPTVFRGQLGSASWSEWKRFNEEVIGVIYAHDRGVIPLVAGFDWAYDLTPVRLAPIDAGGIGYVSHPYPQKVPVPWEPQWERDFGFAADRYPVFVTEFGFAPGHLPGAHEPVIAGEEYGRAIVDFMAARGISWTAWCFDPDWGPQLISDWSYTPTVSGAFFKAVMTGGQEVRQTSSSMADEGRKR